MLVNCVAYQAGKKLADIQTQEIHKYVQREDCFVWVGLLEPDEAELAQMQQEFDLHPLAVEDARHGHQRPKIEEYGHSLFAALHMVDQTNGELSVGELAVFAGPNYVLSSRRGSEHGLETVRERCEEEPEQLRNGSGYVLYALMDEVVDRYFPVIDNLETEYEVIEEAIFTKSVDPREIIATLYALRQKLTRLKHAVEPLLDATNRLYGGRVPHICSGIDEYFRDVHDHLLRLDQGVDSVRDQVTTAMEVNLALAAIEENKVSKRLAAYGALVAVPTMIAGVYGMNFQYMPELSWLFGYPLVLSVMVVVDLYLAFRLRRARWL